jgi:hypothetical protein
MQRNRPNIEQIERVVTANIAIMLIIKVYLILAVVTFAKALSRGRSWLRSS